MNSVYNSNEHQIFIVPTKYVVGIAKLNEWNRTKLVEHSSFYVCGSVLIFFDKEAGH